MNGLVRDNDPYPLADVSEVSAYYLIAFDAEGYALEVGSGEAE
jgi:hypothetical protein